MALEDLQRNDSGKYDEPTIKSLSHQHIGNLDAPTYLDFGETGTKTPIVLVIEMRNSEIVQHLLDTSIWQSTYGILQCAAWTGDETIMSLLLQRRLVDSDIGWKDDNGENALCIAMARRNKAIVDLLLARGTKDDARSAAVKESYQRWLESQETQRASESNKQSSTPPYEYENE
jgi:hypothetical protein